MDRRTFVSTSLLAFMAVVWTRQSPAQDDSASAQSFAATVWKMFDAGNYGQMYDQVFDDSMKQQSKDQWVQIATNLAKQRGNMISRSLANKANSMGIYRYIYNTQCTNGKVFEDVSITKKDSGWKVVGIYIRPNLE
jgi:hypothetical protein